MVYALAENLQPMRISCKSCTFELAMSDYHSSDRFSPQM